MPCISTRLMGCRLARARIEGRVGLLNGALSVAPAQEPHPQELVGEWVTVAFMDLGPA
jgi:hypothetical protein